MKDIHWKINRKIGLKNWMLALKSTHRLLINYNSSITVFYNTKLL